MVGAGYRVLAVVFALCVAEPVLETWIGNACHAQDRGKYVVDGLALGGLVHPGSRVYHRYQCSPSSQFASFTYCVRNKSDATSHGKASSTTTILHESDGSVAYVNKYIAPAFFAANDVENEIARLSAKYAQSAKVIKAPRLAGAPRGVIAVWGDHLRLTPLGPGDVAIARAGGSPGKGILADFAGDFSRSAQLGLPIYLVQGGSGFVWIAHYDDQGRGGLRFFAIDAARLSKAFTTKDVPKNTGPQQSPTTTETHLTLVRDKTQELLDKCGSSCPNDPTADKLRIEIQNKLQQQTLAAQEADTFTAALGDAQKLADYLASCKICEFKEDANRELLALRKADSALADRERNQYNNARGNLRALKGYVAGCQVCVFAKDAVREIQAMSSTTEASLFKFELCNNDHLAVEVAIVGRKDPLSNMWTSEGWWQVGSGQCRTIGTYAKGKFYYFAENRRATWSGNSSFCTSQQPFTILVSGGDCLEGESTKDFSEIDVGDHSKWTARLNAKPWAYTALAWSRQNQAWGWSGNGHKSLDEAEGVALGWCGRNASDCVIAGWVRDDWCLALASGANNDGGISLGEATAANRNEARNNAVRSCGRSDCVVIHDSCSR